MGLFDIFNKNNKKQTIGECFTKTSELIDDISELALRYSVDKVFLNTYSTKKEDIIFINKGREALESVLLELGKDLNNYYNNEYTSVSKTVEENKNFSYSLDSLIELFNNSLDLYSENEEVRDSLNIAYDKCNKELLKLKKILGDDEALINFTGLKPIEKIVEVTEEIKEEVTEETVNESEVLVNNKCEKSYDDVDGDIIINTEKMKVYFIRISRNEQDEISLNLCLENKLENEVEFKIKDVYVDNVLTEPDFKCNVAGQSRVYDKVTFKNNIEQLFNLKATLYITENDSNKVIDEFTVSMFND